MRHGQKLWRRHEGSGCRVAVGPHWSSLKIGECCSCSLGTLETVETLKKSGNPFMLLVPGFMTMLADLLSVARCHGAAPSSYMLNLALRAVVSSGLCSFHASVGPAGVVWWGMCLDIYIYIYYVCLSQTTSPSVINFLGQVKETEVFSERMTWEETADLHSRSDNLRLKVDPTPSGLFCGSHRMRFQKNYELSRCSSSFLNYGRNHHPGLHPTNLM